jgi:hypothetical protein
VDWHPVKGLLATGSRDSQQPVYLGDFGSNLHSFAQICKIFIGFLAQICKFSPLFLSLVKNTFLD